jgi:3-phosphoshikimate 1-carboxyvinyltransferase
MDLTRSSLQRVRGTLMLPPDKSIAHRAAMFASLADGPSVIENFSPAADPQTTLSCFRQLGVPIDQQGDTVTVSGVGRQGLRASDADIDCGNSGTTMRLLTGILAGAGIPATLIGDASLSSRTMNRIIVPLSRMGALVTATGGKTAPLTIAGGSRLTAIRYPLPIASAQIKSCVLLAGLFTDGPTEVVEFTPSRDHTERLLGLPRERQSDGTLVIRSHGGHPIPPQNLRVPGDFSAAAFWLVAGSIYPDSEIILPNTGVNPTRTAALAILQRMGADIGIGLDAGLAAEPTATLTVRSAALKATVVEAHEIPNAIDELPILSVAMAFAEGVSEFRGAEELRHKETDRLAAMASVLTTAGVAVDEMPDGLRIHGRPDFVPTAGTFETWHDHRIAMAAGILAGRAPGLSTVRHAECTAISYPRFWDDFTSVGD